MAARKLADAKRAGFARGQRQPRQKRGTYPMWQRLRAARAYADLTQEDVGKALSPPRSRTAVAFWESATADLRTAPLGEQLMQYARICKVPVEWLLDDTQAPDSLYTYMQRRSGAVPVANPAEREQRRAKAFWSAVEYQTLHVCPELADQFHVPLTSAGVEVEAGFLCGQALCGFINESIDWQRHLVRETSRLLVLERMLGRPHQKHLLMYAPDGLADEESAVEFAAGLDVKLQLVDNVLVAANILCALGRK